MANCLQMSPEYHARECTVSLLPSAVDPRLAATAPIGIVLAQLPMDAPGAFDSGRLIRNRSHLRLVRIGANANTVRSMIDERGGLHPGRWMLDVESGGNGPVTGRAGSTGCETGRLRRLARANHRPCQRLRLLQHVALRPGGLRVIGALAVPTFRRGGTSTIDWAVGGPTFQAPTVRRMRYATRQRTNTVQQFAAACKYNDRGPLMALTEQSEQTELLTKVRGGTN